MQNNISLVMIVKNEEAVLERCLNSVRPFVNEMIIVDTGSEDNTVEIAKSFGAVVYQYEWYDDFSAARNFALSKARYSYRLILDADEYITSWEQEQVAEVLHKRQAGIVTLLDQYNKDGDIKHSKSYLTRLIPSEAYYTGAIHEQVEYNGIRKKVHIVIEHDGYLKKDKSERNLKLLFKLVEQKPKDSYFLYQLAHTLFVSKQYEEAFTSYNIYYEISRYDERYRCGAIVDYLYSCMAVGALKKGLEIIEKEADRYDDSSDFHFVCGHFYRELVLSDISIYINYLPYIEQSFIRCLEVGETNKYDTVVGTGSYEAAYNLGTWYEVTGQLEQAKKYYKMAALSGYTKAIERMEQL